MEDGADRPGERGGQGGLADAGHVLDQRVPAGDQRRHDQPHDLVLAADDALHARDQPLDGLPRALRLRRTGRIDGLSPARSGEHHPSSG
jgi:hypothetical protein